MVLCSGGISSIPNDQGYLWAHRLGASRTLWWPLCINSKAKGLYMVLWAGELGTDPWWIPAEWDSVTFVTSMPIAFWPFRICGGQMKMDLRLFTSITFMFRKTEKDRCGGERPLTSACPWSYMECLIWSVRWISLESPCERTLRCTEEFCSRDMFRVLLDQGHQIKMLKGWQDIIFIFYLFFNDENELV